MLLFVTLWGTLFIMASINIYSIVDPITDVQLSVADGRILEGKSTSLACRAQGEPPIIYSWRKNGMDLTTRMSHKGQISIFRINEIQRGDAGNYSCTADNRARVPAVSNQLDIRVLCKHLYHVYMEQTLSRSRSWLQSIS